MQHHVDKRRMFEVRYSEQTWKATIVACRIVDANTGNAVTSTTLSDPSDRCSVCFVQPQAGVALVSCGHSQFCTRCTDTVVSIDSGSQYAEPHKCGAESICITSCSASDHTITWDY